MGEYIIIRLQSQHIHYQLSSFIYDLCDVVSTMITIIELTHSDASADCIVRPTHKLIDKNR